MCNRFLLLASMLISMLFIETQAVLMADKALWYGSIKFPYDMKTIPPIRIYYAGNKIPAQIDYDSHQISFTISEYSMRNVFYLIIVDTINFVSEQNTIQYLKTASDRPYKLYQLTFTPNKEAAGEQDAHAAERGTWDIVQLKLQDDLRIPDNAIIVCFHSHLVKSVEGGNAVELPKIILNEEVIHKLPEQELYDASIQFLLSSLHCDSIHAAIDSQIKADFQRKTIISLTA